ncbi:hypothetical protein [Candidatus Uabimicrobium sp. HlEnr_7]|uniref:hypothetical protein n=1 Tax=Candidatus Uabimicrobium helgolandensis TaxID=3095367 RepID=UPI00355848B5
MVEKSPFFAMDDEAKIKNKYASLADKYLKVHDYKSLKLLRKDFLQKKLLFLAKEKDG